MLFFSDIALTTRLLQGESIGTGRNTYCLVKMSAVSRQFALDKSALTMREMKSFGLVMTAARMMLSLPWCLLRWPHNTRHAFGDALIVDTRKNT